MPLDKPYAGIPGTTIFDAEQSRKGYWLNQFCMSLMKAENREKFKADERAYLDQWPMTEDQKLAVLSRANDPLEVALSTKYEAIEAYANSEDVREGRRAYAEKREPRWTGR